jgi:hypothetical protein
VYRPIARVQAPLVIVAHGFARHRRNMSGWGWWGSRPADWPGFQLGGRQRLHQIPASPFFPLIKSNTAFV